MDEFPESMPLINKLIFAASPEAGTGRFLSFAAASGENMIMFTENDRDKAQERNPVLNQQLSAEASLLLRFRTYQLQMMC